MKIGDKVKGNQLTNRYNITCNGWEGVILEINLDGDICVEGKNRSGDIRSSWVDLQCFDVIQSNPPEHEIVRSPKLPQVGDRVKNISIDWHSGICNESNHEIEIGIEGIIVEAEYYTGYCGGKLWVYKVQWDDGSFCGKDETQLTLISKVVESKNPTMKVMDEDDVVKINKPSSIKTLKVLDF